MSKLFSIISREIAEDPVKRFSIALLSYPTERALIEQYDAIVDDELWRFAETQRLTGCVARRLASILPADKVPAHWIQAQQNNIQRIGAFLTELRTLGRFLKQQGLDIIVLENGALALHFHPYEEDFTFGDFDLLVQPRDFDRIHLQLVSFGYEPTNSSEHALESLSNGQRLIYHKSLPERYELRLNIQSVLVARNWLSEDPSMLSRYFDRKVTLPNNGLNVLGPEDFLFQLCIHSATHGYIRTPGILLHLDMLWYLQETTIDWQLFVTEIEKTRTKTKCYFSLIIPRDLFGMPVPDEVIQQIKPPHWKCGLIAQWLQEGGMFNPHERKFSRIRYIMFTLLLFDHVSDLWGSLFPSGSWMKEHYNFHHNLFLPYYHIRRIFGLMFKRLYI